MSTFNPLIIDWARSAVVPRNGAFKELQAHDIATPVLHALLSNTGLAPQDIDAVVMGNALGAGGNPARMLALHAGINQACAAYTLDTQCCAGLDAVAMGVAMIASGQADVVIAGGAEAWSRSPIRMHRPRTPNEHAVAYERPAFAPTPEQDPDMLLSAARYAAQMEYTRAAQEAYAVQSHLRAITHQVQIEKEIIPIMGVFHDIYPRQIDIGRAARMPVVARTDVLNSDDACSLSALTISTQADGAAFVLLASPQACEKFNLKAKAKWIGHAAVGCAPETPLLAAELAARQVLQRCGFSNAQSMNSVELHDAFAIQGMSFSQGLNLRLDQLNPHGGGIARGHPIGASAAVALVRLLADLTNSHKSGANGLVAVAGAGGLGSAAVVTIQ